MATATKTTKKKAPAKGKEPWHGTVSGYSNQRCSCARCKKAWRVYSAANRARRYADKPVCRVKKCTNPQSQGAGNGLCFGHAKRLREIRAERDE